MKTHKLKKDGITKVFIFSDIHYPYHHEPTMNIAKQVLKDVKPDYCIYLGDNFDAEGISKYTVKSLESGVAKTVKEIDGFKKMHKELSSLTKAKFLWAGDNHCSERIQDLDDKLRSKGREDAADMYNEMLNLEKNFPDISFVDYNDWHRIGRLTFTHGEYHNDASAKSHAAAYPHDVCYGHIHSCQHYVLRQKSEYPKQAISIGSMCEHNPRYMKNRSHGWIHAFAVAYIRPDGHYNLYTIQVHKRKAFFNGKLYEQNH